MKSSTTAFNSTFPSWHHLQVSGDIRKRGQVCLPTPQRRDARRALGCLSAEEITLDSAREQTSGSPWLDCHGCAPHGYDASQLTTSALFLLIRREAEVDILQNRRKAPFCSHMFFPCLFINFVLLHLDTHSRLTFGQSKWLAVRKFMLLTYLLPTQQEQQYFITYKCKMELWFCTIVQRSEMQLILSLLVSCSCQRLAQFLPFKGLHLSHMALYWFFPFTSKSP